jgi:Tfp pilus assembly protein PilX
VADHADDTTGESGMVTAELAVVLPTLVVVVVLALGGINAGLAQMRCVDAARDGARALARGETTQTAVAVARAAAPRGATVTVHVAGDRLEVTVDGSVALLGPVGRHLVVRVRAAESAQAEPGVGTAP